MAGLNCMEQETGDFFKSTKCCIENNDIIHNSYLLHFVSPFSVYRPLP